MPALKPLTEIESDESIEKAKETASILGLDINKALTGSVAHLFEDAGLDLSKIGRLAFDNEKRIDTKIL